jgi:hypothetical protein
LTKHAHFSAADGADAATFVLDEVVNQAFLLAAPADFQLTSRDKIPIIMLRTAELQVGAVVRAYI